MAVRPRLFVPSRFCPKDALPIRHLSALLARTYRRHAWHVFLGAAGIAVRCLAPLLRHKSQDPPVLVVDPSGRFVICLLSGHWGGGNALARHVASLLDATPVITTASDGDIAAQASDPQPLDMLLRGAGVCPVDWDLLPRAQALLLEGQSLELWDPCHAVPAHPGLRRVPDGGETWASEERTTCHDGGTSGQETAFSAVDVGHRAREGAACPVPLAPATSVLLAAHWRRLPRHPRVLRLAVERLFLGIGCRRHVAPGVLVDAVDVFLEAQGMEARALAAVATVTEKVHEPAVQTLAAQFSLPLRGFAASRLAQCPVPHASAAAGRRFGLPPFGVCEAAALLAAGERGPARLLVPKHVIQGQITLAVAMVQPEVPCMPPVSM